MLNWNRIDYSMKMRETSRGIDKKLYVNNKLDSSIYGAMIRLSQDWVMRYPLIDIHGSNGNQSGDGPAAMRYTEARLSKLSEDGLLAGLKKRNVDFILNYDETMEEPIVLPSIFPNLLCNPNSGIGVAMACSWLPHNLSEVSAAINDYIDGKEPILPGPDFPTGGQIINSKDASIAASIGKGSVIIRGKYKIEKNCIIFYEIPYGQTIEGILDNISDVCNKKEIEGIIDVRNESNKKKGLRIVVECTKKAILEEVVNLLFIKTNLQTSISYNQIGLINKVPQELTLKDCCKIYVEHNIDCVTRELNFDLKKLQARLHIVDGLLIALEDIDNVIQLIKTSENVAKAKENLIVKYKLSEIQAQAILDMKLSKLAKLEKIELQQEKENLVKKIDEITKILLNQNNEIINIIKSRLEQIVKTYGDKRRTELLNIEIKKENKKNVTATIEDVIVLLSTDSSIKKIPATSFQTQKRNGKGVDIKEQMISTIATNTLDTLMLFSNKGRMYKVDVNKIPVGTIKGAGVNINNLIKLLYDDEKIITMTSLETCTKYKYIIFVTKKGLIKKSLTTEYIASKRNTGSAAINLTVNDNIAKIIFSNSNNIFIATKLGMAVCLENDSIPTSGKNTKGVKAISLCDNDEIIGAATTETEEICLITSTGRGKRMLIKDFPISTRNRKGVTIYKNVNVKGTIVSIFNVTEKDNILIVGTTKTIKVPVKDCPIQTSVGSGISLIKNQDVIIATKI